MKLNLIVAGALASLGPIVSAASLVTRAISDSDPTFIYNILDAHNRARQYHGVANLTWNAGMATSAQTWATTLQGSAGCGLQHSGTTGVGENLYGGCCSAPDVVSSTRAGVKAWYNEEAQYNYNAPGFSSATGHFTQVIWKTTELVGCAWSQSGCGSGWYFLVCQYYPQGNVVGAFAQNVPPPTCRAG